MHQQRDASIYRIRFQALFSKAQDRDAGEVLQQLPAVQGCVGQRPARPQVHCYDAGETRRIQHAAPIDEADKKYEKHYPLYEWGWTREECVHVIERAGLPRPGKSSCFFCPSMKKKEIQALWENYPDLFERAIALEHGSAETNVNVKGLGRNWSWESYYNEFMANKEFEEAQLTFDQLFPDSPGGCICGAPCGCYDG